MFLTSLVSLSIMWTVWMSINSPETQFQLRNSTSWFWLYVYLCNKMLNEVFGFESAENESQLSGALWSVCHGWWPWWCWCCFGTRPVRVCVSHLFENVFFGIASSKSTSQTEQYYKHSYPSVHLIMRLILHKCLRMLAVITGKKTASPQRQVYIAAIVDQVSWMGSPLPFWSAHFYTSAAMWILIRSY